MILIVNDRETNVTEFVLEMDEKYKPELIKYIREFENEYYDLKEKDSDEVRGICVGDYIFNKINDPDLWVKLNYNFKFAMWDIVNID